MSIPSYFGNIIVDENAPKDAIYLFDPKYKSVPVGEGEPPNWKEVIDWEATAKASAVIYNIGDAKK